jgi:hypothetical protein
MTKRFSNAGKLAVISLAVAAAVAMPLSASARGWGGYGYRGGYHGYYHHGGYWSGGRWIAGAIVTGAVVGLVANALSPPPVYYAAPPVVYTQPGVVYAQPGVVYQDGPPVVSRTVIYNNPPPAHYVRDDGYYSN